MIWEASDAADDRHKISRSSLHSAGVPDLRTKRRARLASPDRRRPRCSKRHRLDRFVEAPGRQPAIMAAEALTNSTTCPGTRGLDIATITRRTWATSERRPPNAKTNTNRSLDNI